MLQKIRHRVLLAALLPVVLVVASVGALLLTRHISGVERNLIDRSLTLARQAAMLSELPLASGSKASVRAVADFVERSSGIIGLCFVDRDGNTIENRGNLGIAALRMLESKPMGVQMERDAQLVSVVYPVVSHPQSESKGDAVTTYESRVGFVAISLSRDDERLETTSLWWTGIAILATGVALCVVLVQWATRSITRPLSALSQGLSRVASEDFSVQLAESGKGELRGLAENFNQMNLALGRARRGLNEQVTRATEALAIRTREAEAANLAKSRFLAAASHDLRQPAHALSLYCAALRHGLQLQQPQVRDGLIPAVNGMQAASKSLDALLNGLLDISRFDAGVVHVELQRLALRPFVEEVLAVLSPVASEKGLQLRSHVPDIEIESDKTIMRRMLENLISNAIRFSRGGCILLSVRKRKNHVLLQVWDQGIGIAPENVPLVFDEFFQVRRGEAAQGGMGLGLAIVSRSVKMLKGKVDVRSAPGKGTCFSLRLPGLHWQAATAPSANVSLPVIERRRVFIVDDDPLIRDSMCALFQSLGLEPVASSTPAGLPPLAAHERNNVLAAIVDYRLQDGFTGIKAAHKLRTALGPLVPLIIITGDTSADRLRLLNDSGFAVLHKPLSTEQLLAALGLKGLASGVVTRQ
jgi:two-component system, sensor histidine kinase